MCLIELKGGNLFFDCQNFSYPPSGNPFYTTDYFHGGHLSAIETRAVFGIKHASLLIIEKYCKFIDNMIDHSLFDDIPETLIAQVVFFDCLICFLLCLCFHFIGLLG